jgi:hypothetical protein
MAAMTLVPEGGALTGSSTLAAHRGRGVSGPPGIGAQATWPISEESERQRLR